MPRTLERKAPVTYKEKYEEALKEIDRLNDRAYCRMCDGVKDKDEFYVSTDPMCKGHIAPICKECARKIAERVDENGDIHQPTKESVMKALEYLDKPFVETLWTASIQETNNLRSGHVRTTAWRAYIKNVQMGQWAGQRWKDSDQFKTRIVYDDEKTEKQLVEENAGKDSYDSFQKNKEDVVRLIGYDPFETEMPQDQVILYSQLIGMLDSSEDANEDMLRVSAAISIARGFLQIQKIDNTLVSLMGNINLVADNSSTIKSLQDCKAKITSSIQTMAAENCLSLKNNKSSKAGNNSWTGNIKKIKDLNLREGQLNGFDMATCKAMEQIKENSDAAMLKQISLDESEYSDVIKDLRETNSLLRKQRDSYKEMNRILLRENIDLKDTFEDKGIDISKDCVDLKDLYSSYRDVSKDEYDGEKTGVEDGDGDAATV